MSSQIVSACHLVRLQPGEYLKPHWFGPSQDIVCSFLFVLITPFSLDDYLQVETLITGGQVAETGGVINQV